MGNVFYPFFYAHLCKYSPAPSGDVKILFYNSCKSLAKADDLCYTNTMMKWQDFQNKRICVAISGGGDSVALLHYLKSLQKSHCFFLSAVHCEHGIRGEESLADMRFVKALCEGWQVPLSIFLEDCPLLAKREKVSLETAARNFRYACFSKLIEEGKTDFIALAHHVGDEAETVLFRLARGASLRGMSAMKAQNGVFLRPLLKWKKEDILAYLQENKLAFCEDSTNLQKEATRNFLRLEILPKLEEVIPNASENIARFAALAAEDDELLYELSAFLLFEKDGTPCVRFSKQKPLFTRACLTAMQKMGVEKDYTATHLNGLFALQGLERGSLLSLPKGLTAKREENHLVFYYPQEIEVFEKAQPIPYAKRAFEWGRYAVKVCYDPPMEGSSKWKVLKIDEEKLPIDVLFRFRKEGDFIYRFGGGKKSLKKFFNEKKLPVEARGHLPLIADEKGEVFVACGVEISEKVKVDERTKTVAYITIGEKA